MRRSRFALASGRRAKWVVFVLWFLAIFIAAGPANLPGKFEDAESNEATSYLPESAESTKALAANEELQDGEIAPAVIVFRRQAGLTPADFKSIEADVGKMSAKRFEGVVPDGETAASGGKPGGEEKTAAASGPAGGGTATTAVPGQPGDYAPFVGPVCSRDGKAAIVTSYINAEGEGERIVDPVKYWRDALADQPAGLEAKVT